MRKPSEVARIEDLTLEDPPRLLIFFDKGQQSIVQVIADVLGQAFVVVESAEVGALPSEPGVVGLENGKAMNAEALRDVNRTILSTHALDVQDLRNDDLTLLCDYEYLYTVRAFTRHDLTRFLGFIFGVIRPHDHLRKKARSTLLSMTCPDIRAVLPHADIFTIGTDAIELRVDLLQEPKSGSSGSSVPSLDYVGEQVMLLRQSTELPIVFTTRCTRYDGRFPMDDPMQIYTYLRKAVQWGCAYIDVELWLPEDVRSKIAKNKRNTKIISTFQDFSGSFCWSTDEAWELFKDGAAYGDIIKMVALVDSVEEDYELESFRSVIASQHPEPPFCGLNISAADELSHTLNTILTPISHPLLPSYRRPEHMSIAEMNTKLFAMNRMPAVDVYAVGSDAKKTSTAVFIEKYLNELNLPHQLRYVDRLPSSPPDSTVTKRARRVGALMMPPVLASIPSSTTLTEAAAQIGHIDALFPRATANGTMNGENITWKAIRNSLTRDFLPSAFKGKPALIIGDHCTISTCSATLFALKELHFGPIYSVGFKPSGALASEVHYISDMDRLRELPKEPLVIVSALPPRRAVAATPLLKLFARDATAATSSGRIFLDLSHAAGTGQSPVASLATDLGWMVAGSEDVRAWMIVETLRGLFEQTVGFDFVKGTI